MNFNTDLILAASVVGLLFFTGTLYFFRLLSKGRKSFERIERDGSGALIGKGAKEMGFWIISPLAKILVKLKVSANAVSIVGLILSFVAGLTLIDGRFGIALVFVLLGSLCDALDGWIARSTNSASMRGAIIDSSIDRYVEFFTIGGLIIFYRENIWLLVITLLALFGAFMVSYSTAKADEFQLTPPRGSMRRSDRAVFLMLGCLLSPFSMHLFAEDQIGYPMIACLTLIAFFANISAFIRLLFIANNAEKKPL